MELAFVDIGWLVTNETHAWEQRALTDENNGKYRRNVYPKTWLFPPVTRPFGSLRLSAPRESERFLEYRFTSGWNNTCVVAHWDHRLEIWRYRDSGPTVAPCDTVSVDLVRRSRYPNGSSVEELTSSDERLVAVGRFEDDSLVSYSVMPSSVMPSKTMVHKATAHEWMDAAAHHHGDDRAAPAEPLDAPAEPLDADLYYINLQRRPDRNAALLRQLDRVGYDRAHVHRINATAHADGAAGCLLSHVAALEAVVARAEAAGGGGGVGGGRPFALVLEDDFEWNDAALARAAARRLRAAGQLVGDPARVPRRAAAAARRRARRPLRVGGGVLHHLGLHDSQLVRAEAPRALPERRPRAPRPRRKRLALLGSRR